MRMFETYSPGVTLACVIAGVGTLLFGLPFAIPYFIGVLVRAAGHALDNFGLESKD